MSAAPRSLRTDHGTPSDAELVTRVRAGDREAFDLLVTMHCDALCQFAGGCVDSLADGEELVQELFLRIWRMGARWEVRSNLRSYLFSAVHKMASSHRRRATLLERWRQRVVAGDGSPFMGQLEATDKRIEGRELRSALARAIAQLPARRRVIASLRFEHGLTCPEIARVVGSTTKAVELQVAKALRTVRQALAEHLDR